MDLYTIKLEDNKNYIIMDTVINNDNKYLILSSSDEDNFTIRKVIVDSNNEECLIKLDDEEEYTKILSLFYKNHKEE